MRRDVISESPSFLTLLFRLSRRFLVVVAFLLVLVHDFLLFLLFGFICVWWGCVLCCFVCV